LIRLAPVESLCPGRIPDTAYDAWLDPNANIEQISALLQPFPADRMRYWPVSMAVNQARNNTPDLIEPI
jgi:putative SOS response-associated peptidase YedK